VEFEKKIQLQPSLSIVFVLIYINLNQNIIADKICLIIHKKQELVTEANYCVTPGPKNIIK